MKKYLLSVIRNKDSTKAEYRDAVEKLGYLLAGEASSFLFQQQIQIQTPLAQTQGFKFQDELILVPIMRSGLALLPPFLRFYHQAQVGFIGIRRDEITTLPHLYYHHLPTISKNHDLFLLEPMIATAGSILTALDLLIREGASEEKIYLISILGAPEGLSLLKEKMPKLKILVAHVDEHLNASKFIVPGLGDFGDRYFGTEKNS